MDQELHEFPSTTPEGQDTVSNDGINIPKEENEEDFFVVGIGSSAGGLEALQSFLVNISPDSNAAYVLVQHLSPVHKSFVAELLSRETNLIVVTPVDGTPLRTGRVYVSVPGFSTIVQNGTLCLKPISSDVPCSIDDFFVSLANNSGPSAVGIVLSGTGSDGSRGIRAIKEFGGLVMVQEPKSALFSSMPLHAIQTGATDYVNRPEDMPGVLQSYFEHRFKSIGGANVGMNSRARMICAALSEMGTDFSMYRPETVMRRIMFRMSVAKVSSLEEYKTLIESDESERRALFRELTINVTEFFRNPDAFLALKGVLDNMIKTRRSLRVWVVGCSTGEEPYSVAMLIDSIFKNSDLPASYKIFATDIDSDALSVASQGMYSRTAAGGIPPQYKEYCVDCDDQIMMHKKIRKRIVFAYHDLLQNPPFRNLDLAVCRNLLIYFGTEAREVAVQMMLQGLNDGGVIFFGASEGMIGNLARLVDVIDSQWHIYRLIHPMDRREATLGGRSAPYHLPTYHGIVPLSRERAYADTVTATEPPAVNEFEALSFMSEEYLPPCVVVSPSGTLVHSFRTEKLLVLRSGTPSLRVVDVLPKPLGESLMAAIEVVKQRGPTSVDCIPVGDESWNLKVLPYHGSDSRLRGHFAAYFKKHSEADTTKEITNVSYDSEMFATVERIESERAELERQLGRGLEAFEASSEELVASNEELQSSNEEMVSTMEELQTVNAQLESKTILLDEALVDLDNLLRSLDIPVIYVDRNLCIRRFTEAVKRVLPIREVDISRPLADLSIVDVTGAIQADLETVVKGKIGVVERKIVSGGETYLLRLLPYLDVPGSIDGVLVTMLNISDVEKLQHERDTIQTDFERLVDASINPIFGVRATDNVVHLWNRKMSSITGISRDVVVGKSTLDEVLDPEAMDVLTPYLQTARAGGDIVDSVEVSSLNLLISITTLHSVDGSVSGFVLSGQDIGPLKRQMVLEMSAKAAQESSRLKTEFVATISHELRTPLSAILAASEVGMSDSSEHEVQDMFATIKRSVEQLSYLVDDVLDFSRMETGKALVEDGPVVIQSVIENAIEAVQHIAREKKLDLGYVIDSTCPSVFIGDRLKLLQVLNNLVSNAVKFTDSGYVNIYASHESDVLKIVVADSGIGMSLDELDNVLEPFRQADSTVRRRYGGSGLGLAISRSLARLMGGDLLCSSKGLGHGSHLTFTCKAPRVKGMSSSSSQGPLVDKEIVIVDDAEIVREFVKTEMRTMCKLPIVALGNASDAVKYLENHRTVDIVFLDEDLDGANEVKAAVSNIGRAMLVLLTWDNSDETHIRKPLVARNVSRFVVDVPSSPPASPTRVALVSLKVLVVDDNPVNVRLAAMLLKRLGHVVATAASGEQAIIKVAQDNYDCILMDLHMPEMDGIEAARRILSMDLSPTPQIVAWTADARIELQTACKDAGMVTVLLKPCPLKAMKECLDGIVPEFCSKDSQILSVL